MSTTDGGGTTDPDMSPQEVERLRGEVDELQHKVDELADRPAKRHRMRQVVAVILVILTFALCLFGTFLTRSGVIQSVHAFANSPQSPFFLAFIGIVLLASFGLVGRRWDLLKSEHELDSVASREAGFIGNNLLLLGIGFATFWGTIWPVVTEVLTNARVTVSTPFFNRVNGPLFGALVLLMGLTLLLGWRRTRPESFWRGLIAPCVIALLVVAGLWLAGLRDAIGLVGFGIIGFSTVATLAEFAMGMNARHRATREPYPVALVNLVRKQRRRYGGYLVHIAFFMMCTGVIGSNVYQLESEATLRKGESFAIGPYTLTYQDFGASTAPNKDIVAATLGITENGQSLGTISPTRFFYKSSDQPVTEAAIRTSLRDDLYILLAGWDARGDSVTLKMFVNPLVIWIWIGGFFLLLGTLVSSWPSALARAATESVRVGREQVAGRT